MFYRVNASLVFSDPDEARDFYHDCEVALPKATIMNPCLPTQECSTIQLEECHHDEHPITPCEVKLALDNCPVCST